MKVKESAAWDYAEVETGAQILRALNHKLRQSILKLIDESKEKRMNVTDIYVNLRIEQSIASQHLAILRKAGIVKTERDGKNIRYTVNHDRLNEIREYTANLVKGQPELQEEEA